MSQLVGVPARLFMKPPSLPRDPPQIAQGSLLTKERQHPTDGMFTTSHDIGLVLHNPWAGPAESLASDIRHSSKNNFWDCHVKCHGMSWKHMETHTPTHTPRHHGAAMSQIRGIDQQIAQTQTGSHGLYSHGLLILVLRKESVASLIVASAMGQHKGTS